MLPDRVLNPGPLTNLVTHLLYLHAYGVYSYTVTHRDILIVWQL